MSRTRPGRPGQPGPAGPAGPAGSRELAQLVIDRTIVLCGIPAPPRHEQQRAQVVRDWWAADDPPGPIRAVIALEGNYRGRVNVTGVGSTRWRVTVSGPGGHAWEEASQPSAVHEAARLITVLAALARPGDPKTTVNVGLIEGGESVNSRAQRAEFLVDLRSGDPAALVALRTAGRAVLDDPAVPLAVSVHASGERPAGQLDPGHPLATLAAQVLREAGIAPRLTAASTDANAAYPRGIPALTLGITTGEGTHTEQEWIDADPVQAGLAALAAMVARLDGQEW